MKHLFACAAAAIALAACNPNTGQTGSDTVTASGPGDANAPDAQTLGDPETPATLGADNNAIPQPLTDAAFVRLAKLSNQLEIDTSQLALQKSNDSGIKQFAQRMIDDHAQAGRQLESAAGAVSNLGESTQGPDPLGGQTILARLRQASGADFDREYKLAQIQAHEWTVELFEDAKDADALNAGLKTFANQTLPKLRDHLTQARALGPALPAGVGGGANPAGTTP